MSAIKPVDIRIVQKNAPVATGIQEFAIQNWNPSGIKAALFIATNSDSIDSISQNFNLGFGACDGTSQFAIASTSRDNLANTESKRRNTSSQCILILNPAGGTIDGSAAFNSFTSSGVRINWNDAPADDYIITCVLFAGSGLQAKAGIYNQALSNGSSTVVNTIGFESDNIMFFSDQNVSVDSTVNDAKIHVGLLDYTGSTITQRSQNFYSQHNASFSNVKGYIAIGRIFRNLLSIGGTQTSQEITAVSSTGFTATTRDANSNQARTYYLALKYSGNIKHGVGNLNRPSSTGVVDYNIFNFQPTFGLELSSNMLFFNSERIDGNAGTFSVGIFDRLYTTHSHNITEEDLAGTSNNSLENSNNFVNINTHTQGAGITGVLQTINNDGWSVNYTNQSIGTTPLAIVLQVENIPIEENNAFDCFIRGANFSGILQGEDVLFYHPLNDEIEYTMELAWSGNAIFNESGMVSSGMYSPDNVIADHKYLIYNRAEDNEYGDFANRNIITFATWLQNIHSEPVDADGFRLGTVNSTFPPENIRNGFRLSRERLRYTNNQSIQGSWIFSPGIQDNDWHFVVARLEQSGSFINGKLSLDGHPWEDIGSITGTPLGSGTYLKISIEDPNNPSGLTPFIMADETIVWTNNEEFTSLELCRLYQLGAIHNEPMPNFFLHEAIVSGQMELFIAGHERIDLYIDGFDIHTNNTDLIIDGHIKIVDNKDLFIDGKGFISRSMILYTNTFNVFSRSRNLSIFGKDTLNDDLDLFINGIEKSQIDLFIKSFDLSTNELNLSTFGLELQVDNLNLFVSGSGIIPINDNITLIIGGLIAKEPFACETLDPTAAIQISDTLIEIYQGRIDALINQLGKNVLLEFDPVIENCPNCGYDSIRKKSNGIYTPGGPRPFISGKCPWCKGIGLLETKVQKCIQCLIQSKPRDYANYGISIQDGEKIIRLKTFLSDFHNIKKAKYAIIDYDQIHIVKQKCVLIRGPIPVGLREDRYCISFWRML